MLRPGCHWLLPPSPGMPSKSQPQQGLSQDQTTPPLQKLNEVWGACAKTCVHGSSGLSFPAQLQGPLACPLLELVVPPPISMPGEGAIAPPPPPSPPAGFCVSVLPRRASASPGSGRSRAAVSTGQRLGGAGFQDIHGVWQQAHTRSHAMCVRDSYTLQDLTGLY